MNRYGEDTDPQSRYFSMDDDLIPEDDLSVELGGRSHLLSASPLMGREPNRTGPQSIRMQPNELSDNHKLLIYSLRLRKWTHFVLSISLLAVQAMLAQLTQGDISHKRTGYNTTGLVLAGIICLCQVLLAGWTVRFLLLNRSQIRLNDVWVHFLGQICNFAGIYFYTWLVQRDHWWQIPHLPGADLNTMRTNPWSAAFIFVYFSTQTQTLVGYGDVAPLSFVPSIPCTLQMLLGILYISIFIGNTVDSLRSRPSAVRTPTDPGSLDKPWYVLFRKWLRSRMLVVMVLEFLAKTAVVHATNSCILQFQTADTKSTTLACCMLIASLLELIALCFVSFKFVRRDKAHLVTLSFILQAYLSAALLFVGVYMTTLAFDSHSWQLSWRGNAVEQGSAAQQCDTMSSSERAESFLITVAEFVYISISTMTSAGQGAAYPLETLARGTVVIQNLVSVFFSAVILSFGARSFSPGSVSGGYKTDVHL
eukprot:TRINITY_DN9178_c0_g1_i1.p1 TRINITY_DN9178_c0_g1~~TRINITY_DN9178_c0_g1_i1.p1  ORF type:complete len:479 (+),score=91.91 TRINITY_DN9178_c0_g1_i1:3-1439(+)